MTDDEGVEAPQPIAVPGEATISVSSSLETKLDIAIEETKAQRKERRRSDWVVRIALVFGLALMLMNLQSNIESKHQGDDIKSTLAAQEEARKQSREILRNLLAYADPTSDVVKKQQAETDRVSEKLVNRLTEALFATADCRYESRADFRPCLSEALKKADVTSK